MASDEVIEQVLSAVEAIPTGTVATYGDLAELVGIGPRQVGMVMSRHGAGVPWWRVTNAKGELPAHLLTEAARHWADEGIALRSDQRGCRLARHRVDPVTLATRLAASSPD